VDACESSIGIETSGASVAHQRMAHQPARMCITSSLYILNADAPTLSKHSAIYEETKVVIDVWPGRLVCATVANAG
jgi:hypothetical protein